MKNLMMTFCLIVTIVFIWIWHHQTQFNDYSRKALFHLKNSELDSAAEAYTKAIRHKKYTFFFTQEPSAHNNLGQVYLQQAKHHKAITAFKKVIELKPDAVEAYINLATAYLKQNLPNQAIESCEQALQISPNTALSHYNLACAYALKDENERAIDSLQMAVHLDARMRDFAHNEPAFDDVKSYVSFPSE